MSGYLTFKINNNSCLGAGAGGECPLSRDDDGDDETTMMVAVCYELGKHLLCTV